VLRHPWKGTADCEAGKKYFAELPKRQRTEAQTLANLTGWDISEIYKKMGLADAKRNDLDKKWYQKVFAR
jgi:hypothetical protein